MRMEKRNISRIEDIRQCVLLWKMFGVCVVLLVCIIGKRNNVQAAEYDYPIEETKVVQVLDEDCRDSQGIILCNVDSGLRLMSNYYIDLFIQCVLLEQLRKNPDLKPYVEDWMRYTKEVR